VSTHLTELEWTVLCLQTDAVVTTTDRLAEEEEEEEGITEIEEEATIIIEVEAADEVAGDEEEEAIVEIIIIDHTDVAVVVEVQGDKETDLQLNSNSNKILGRLSSVRCFRCSTRWESSNLPKIRLKVSSEPWL